MKFNIKKDWKFYFIITIGILLIVLLSIYMVDINGKLYTKGQVQLSTGDIEEINVGTEINQTFIAIDNNLQKVNIDFEPYKTDVNCGGEVIIGIRDENGNIIKENKITRNYVREKENYTLKFDKQKDSKNKKYNVYIKFNDLGKYNKFYSLKYTDQNEFLNNKLYINGEEKVGSSLIFQDFYKSQIRTLIFYITLLVMILGTYIISSIIYYKKSIKIENIFLMVAPFVCIFFLLTMPLFRNHDEYYHWLKAYEVSEGALMTPIKDGVQGSVAPYGITEAMPKDWTTMTYRDIKEKANMNLDKEKTEIINLETAAVYSFVQYITQALGIFIARCITSTIYILSYIGRIFNMITAIMLIYFAIKIIPFGKNLILIPALIPIAIEGFTSLSPDALTISMAFLYISYILHLSFDDNVKIKLKEKCILILLSSIIALCKIVYIPLVGLMLIIPKEKFKNESNISKVLNFILVASIALVLNLGWLAISSRYLSTFREGDSTIQVMLALKNPVLYIQTLLYTININASNYLLGLFGSQLGWGELTNLYSIIPYTILGIYLFATMVDEDVKGKFKNYQIVWILLVLLAIVALIFTSLYVQWTTIGSVSILGVQGRYFLPILPLIMLLLGSVIKVKSEYDKEKINKCIVISLLVLQIYTIAQILIVHL